MQQLLLKRSNDDGNTNTVSANANGASQQTAEIASLLCSFIQEFDIHSALSK